MSASALAAWLELAKPAYAWQVLPMTLVVFGCGVLVGALVPERHARLVGCLTMVGGSALILLFGGLVRP